MRMTPIVNNESGSTLVFVLLMLVLLTIIGISGLNDTDFELDIATNDIMNKRDFYVAEGGWNHGLQWLESMLSPPSRVNTAIASTTDVNYDVVRNYGNGNSGVLNATFAAGTADGTLTAQNIPYWFRVRYESEGAVPGSGGQFKGLTYLITSAVDDQPMIEVRAEKIFKIGY